MVSGPTAPNNGPAVMSLITESGHRAADSMTNFVQLASAAQRRRLQSGSARYAEVTRSTALWCAAMLDDGVASDLRSAADGGEAPARGETLGELLELTDLASDVDVADVAMHEEFARAWGDYLSRLPDVRAVDPADLALAVLLDAKVYGGKLAQRLEELGIDVAQAVELVRRRVEGPAAVVQVARSVDTKLIADTPAEIDLLDREGFANVLASLIRQQRGGSNRMDSSSAGEASFGRGPILIQLFGAWGSGKTSFTGFVRRSLEHPRLVFESEELERWLFVTFDAWQHQRTAPPWWWLMDRVYRDAMDRRHFGTSESKRDEGASRRVRRWRVWWWRWGTAVLAGLALMALIGVLAWLRTDPLSWLPRATTAVQSVVGFLAALGGVYVVGRGFRGSLMVGSPRAATALLRSGGDPMRRVHAKFGGLVKAIGIPVLVFVDNLDRCQPAYVVELLEGIQTIFADVPVTYLVAADQEWVAHSFESQYAELAKVMGRPGRPLGYLFLEKIFAVSAPLPHANEAARARYWQAVLRAGGFEREQVSAKDRQQAKAEMATDGIESALVKADALDANDRTPRARAVREAVAIRVVEETARGGQDHELMPYLRFLEPNPRALKRLRNAVSIARAAQLTSGSSARRDDDLDALVRWTILTLRWPELAMRLSREPALAASLCNNDGAVDHLGDAMAGLADDEGLRRLLTTAIDGRKPNLVDWISREFDDPTADEASSRT